MKKKTINFKKLERSDLFYGHGVFDLHQLLIEDIKPELEYHVYRAS